MKISDASQLSALDRRPTERSPKPNQSGFQKVFDKVLDQVTTAKNTPSTGIHTATPPPLAINLIEPLHSTSAVQAMERFIDSLEDYQKGLENPQYHLRDLEPALERLEREHGRLSHWANDSSSDNPLKRIMREGLVTATLEMSRFRSGAYC